MKNEYSRKCPTCNKVLYYSKNIEKLLQIIKNLYVEVVLNYILKRKELLKIDCLM